MGGMGRAAEGAGRVTADRLVDVLTDRLALLEESEDPAAWVQVRLDRTDVRQILAALNDRGVEG